MNSIFMISPNYLQFCYQEAVKYDFTLQGYGSSELGSKGLLKINISNLLGFVYFADTLPDNLSSLKEFLYRCNLISNGKKFLFALLDYSRLAELNLSEYQNLNIKLLKINDVVTDTLINRSIFGSILLDNFEPYLFHEDDDLNVPQFSTFKLDYSPIFSKDILKCLEHVHLLNSFEDTIDADEVYRYLSCNNAELAKFRRYYVKTFFFNNVEKGDLEEILDNKINSTDYFEYRALLALISSAHNII